MKLSAKGQTRREAGAQSHGPPGDAGEVAGLPKGVYAGGALDCHIDTRTWCCRGGLRGVAGERIRAQLRTSSDRRSKILKDLEHIEATVMVEGVGTLVFKVDGGGRYSLRGYPEGDEASGRDLLALGVHHAEGTEAVYPFGVSVTENE